MNPSRSDATPDYRIMRYSAKIETFYYLNLVIEWRYIEIQGSYIDYSDVPTLHSLCKARILSILVLLYSDTWIDILTLGAWL